MFLLIEVSAELLPDLRWAQVASVFLGIWEAKHSAEWLGQTKDFTLLLLIYLYIVYLCR